MVLIGWFSVGRPFTVVKRWFGRIQGSRNLCKSMKHACENRIRKRNAELKDNGVKMEPKSEPEIFNISRSTGRKASQKRYGKKVPNGI